MRGRLNAVALSAIFLVGCGGGAATSSPPAPSVAPPTATSSSAAPTTPSGPRGVVYADYGGASTEARDKAWIQPCEASTGIDVTLDTGLDYAKMKAMAEGGQVTWDIVGLDPSLGLNSQSKWFEPIDYTKIERDDLVATTDYRAANLYYGTVLGYNTEKTGGQVPESWADFFDTAKIPGKRAVWDYSLGGLLEIALVADGVKADDLYPLDVERALAKLDTIKDDLVFWTSGSQAQDLLGSGEVALAMIWNGRAWNAKNVDNLPVEIQWNQQFLGIGYYGVVKGAPNKDAAMEMIACMVSPEINGKITQYIPYSPANTKATPEGGNPSDLPSSHLDGEYYVQDDQWLADNFETVDKAYQEWKTR